MQNEEKNQLLRFRFKCSHGKKKSKLKIKRLKANSTKTKTSVTFLQYPAGTFRLYQIYIKRRLSTKSNIPK